MSRNNDNNGKTRGPTHWIKIKNVEGKFVTVAGVWRDTKNGEERLRGKRLKNIAGNCEKDQDGNLIIPEDTAFWVFPTKENTGA